LEKTAIINGKKGEFTGEGVSYLGGIVGLFLLGILSLSFIGRFYSLFGQDLFGFPVELLVFPEEDLG